MSSFRVRIKQVRVIADFAEPVNPKERLRASSENITHLSRVEEGLISLVLQLCKLAEEHLFPLFW
jgi:hypothetical protein